jgi:hypothetical protein
VFIDFTEDARSVIIAVLGETDQSSAEMQLCEGYLSRRCVIDVSSTRGEQVPSLATGLGRPFSSFLYCPGLLPLLTLTNHIIQDRQQLAHASYDCKLFGFTALQ